VIDNDGSRSKAIAAVVKGLSPRMGEMKKALEVTSAITDNRTKPEAQISIVRAYAVKRPFGQALATSDSLVELYSPLALNALLYTLLFDTWFS
jgi:hypothetical protein